MSTLSAYTILNLIYTLDEKEKELFDLEYNKIKKTPSKSTKKNVYDFLPEIYRPSNKEHLIYKLLKFHNEKKE